MLKYLIVCLLNGFTYSAFCQQTVLVFGDANKTVKEKLTLSGRVLDADSGQPISEAVLHLQPIDKNSVTEEDGSYALTIPAGIYTLSIRFLGYKEYMAEIHIYRNAIHDFILEAGPIELQGITIRGNKTDDNITSVMGSMEQLSIEKLERQAKFLGEMDVLRSLQSVTGVTSAGEGASGFNVRGGDSDENLVLMEDNLVINPVHALGFFSLFHPDMVQGVTLYKGGVPAKYGGRLSSVLDVKLREGNDQQLSAMGGVGIASSRLVLEGPIVKNKASFIVGARASYVDWILKQTRNVDLRKSQAFFYDLTAKADARLSETTRLGITAFNTRDNFQFAHEVKFEYATSSGSFYVHQLLSEKINIKAMVNAGQYLSKLFDVDGNDKSEFSTKIRYLRGGLSGFYQPARTYQMELGIEQISYRISPGRLDAISVIKPELLPDEQGNETGFFIHNQWTLNKKIELMAGLRYAIYKNLGPERVLLYDEGVPKTEETIADSVQFADGEKIVQYSGLEPRMSLRISIGEASSVKLGYNRSYQFFSQISNTASPTPIDIWQLSNYHIEPQHADNFSIGYYRNFRENTMQSYVVLFYREIHQLIDYKDFAQLLLNHHIETELLTGTGRAYGAEMYFNKAYGRHRFEVNYTFSRTLRKVEASATQESVSSGDWYPSNYDKPHSLNLNYFFQIKPKSSFSVNFTYSTGRPTTAPVSSFSTSNVLTIPIYSERNQFRIPDYHRLDVAYTIGPWGNKKRWRNSLTLSIYNLYFRKNAFSVFFRQRQFSSVKAYRVSVLGTMFPAVTYDFKF
ncbi:MAG TPA: carboxypeptidase-like regulatory domain-containing protein [Saprospiraceae bacterium]|nr:carboxypeptidase-like regulatory domain-containing protein [Saprospiraceae bacterium]